MGILGELELPIVWNPTEGGPVAARLAARVSEAGGLGVIRAGDRSTAQLRENLLAARAVTSRPLGVDVLVGGGYSDDPDRYYAYALRLAGEGTPVTLGRPRFNDDSFNAKVNALLADPAAVVCITAGLPSRRVVHDLRSAGSEVWLTVTSADEARDAAALGADALVVQDVQARAARDLDLLAALQLIGSAVNLPLVAAGSIMTGAGVAAVLVAGASAAQLGGVHLRAPAEGKGVGDDIDAAEVACRLAADARVAIDVAAHSLLDRQPRSRP